MNSEDNDNDLIAPFVCVMLIIVILIGTVIDEAHQIAEYKRILVEHNIAEYNSSGEFEFKEK